ncbi:hypothetical protein BKA59DRAFT_162546 [Fusarium tricinctum]|jgi:hypothetical protein|uniref:Uncharacterized protein n=1 Tax=Fusarium tricinctum TaxID=61284 RepID=A0A8K0S2N8_9HYPO|nr:hypothetical protein BKA59DRAFT_162546 [Fusarium tricinctum]
MLKKKAGTQSFVPCISFAWPLTRFHLGWLQHLCFSSTIFESTRRHIKGSSPFSRTCRLPCTATTGSWVVDELQLLTFHLFFSPTGQRVSGRQYTLVKCHPASPRVKHTMFTPCRQVCLLRGNSHRGWLRDIYFENVYIAHRNSMYISLCGLKSYDETLDR